MVISALRKEEEYFSSFGHLISSIKHYFSFSANSLAHSLAKHARTIDSFSMWMEDVSPQVADVLLADCGWFWFYKVEVGFSKKKTIFLNLNPDKTNEKEYWIFKIKDKLKKKFILTATID